MILIPPIPTFFQRVNGVKEVITTNDATVQGLMLGAILALAGALVYVYVQKTKREKEHREEIRDLHNRFIDEIKKMNDKLIDVNNTNFQTIQMIEKMTKQ